MKLSPLPGGKRGALLMGVLTALFCLLVADGLLGLAGFQGETAIRYSRMGNLIYRAALIGLPLVFAKRVKWKDTFVNLAAYPLLYLAAAWAAEGLDALGITRQRKFLGFFSGVLFSFPGEKLLVITLMTLRLWLVQAAILWILEQLEEQLGFGPWLKKVICGLTEGQKTALRAGSINCILLLIWERWLGVWEWPGLGQTLALITIALSALLLRKKVDLMDSFLMLLLYAAFFTVMSSIWFGQDVFYANWACVLVYIGIPQTLVYFVMEVVHVIIYGPVPSPYLADGGDEERKDDE